MNAPVSYAASYPHTCNKALYVAMALLFGTFGVHKFCAGRVWMGILYFLLSWTFIPTVLGIIEGILAAFKPTDSLGAIVV
ncbi:TM2 domain-containing protein [Neisseria dentiae]|uniref:TM2 domain-containing protein n=1 Tax=Neisseria dentiae TaxID=194197 RepID=UPI0035A1C752